MAGFSNILQYLLYAKNAVLVVENACYWNMNPKLFTLTKPDRYYQNTKRIGPEMMRARIVKYLVHIYCW